MSSWKEIRRKVRRPFETGGVIVLELIIPLLPRVTIVGLSRLSGQLAMLFPSREKKVGLKNLDAVFGVKRCN